MTESQSTARNELAPWKRYQRQGVIEARPSRMSDITEHSRGNPISVSDADARQWPLIGDKGYVARNPDNHADQWYIAPDYFAKHYADEDSTLLSRLDALRAGLIEAEALLCDERGGPAANELAARIRALLEQRT